MDTPEISRYLLETVLLCQVERKQKQGEDCPEVTRVGM